MDFFENDLQFNKIIFRDRFYYPPEINASIHDLTSYFRANIVSNTPFIYLFAPNHIKTIIAYFAIIKSGHVCVLVEPDIGRLELAEMKQDTPPCALVHIDRITDTFDYGKEIVFTHDNPQEYDWDELSDVATIVYTNAEDGYAKGAMLTRKNLLANAESGCERDELTNENIICALLPLSHMFGLQTGLLTPLFSKSVILLEDISSLGKLNKILNNIHQFKVTNIYSIPLIYHLLPKISNFKILISDVIKFCSGGCALSFVIYDTFFLKSNKRIYEGYGLTECSPVCAFPANSSVCPIGSVGKPLKCNEIKIQNDISILAPNCVGEICIKGKNVFKGYYNNNEINRLHLIDGWFFTRDCGKIDSNGYLYITGCNKKVINIGSKKVFPSHIERLIMNYDKIKNISVIKITHPIYNETMAANIELTKKGFLQEIAFKNWCLLNLCSYKIPKIITFT
jgi:long-subunit acyl-CoA synthetase (AMP-forming)